MIVPACRMVCYVVARRNVSPATLLRGTKMSFLVCRKTENFPFLMSELGCGKFPTILSWPESAV